jgi:hypothetical protein
MMRPTAGATSLSVFLAIGAGDSPSLAADEFRKVLAPEVGAVMNALDMIESIGVYDRNDHVAR